MTDVRREPTAGQTIQPARDEPATEGTVEPLREAARAVAAPRWVTVHRTQIFSSLALIALAIFTGLAILVSDGLTSGVDLAVTRAIQSLAFPGLESLMVGVSWIGFPPQSPLFVVAVAALFWLAGFRAEAGFAVAAAASNALTETIKMVIARPRPGAELVNVITGASGTSFPSGHTLFYVTFFGFLAYVAYARTRHGWLRTAVLVLCGLLIALIGPSRVWMGQHWASDVLASYALGIAYLVALIQIYTGYRAGRAAASASAAVPAEHTAAPRVRASEQPAPHAVHPAPHTTGAERDGRATLAPGRRA